MTTLSTEQLIQKFERTLRQLSRIKAVYGGLHDSDPIARARAGRAAVQWIRLPRSR